MSYEDETENPSVPEESGKGKKGQKGGGEQASELSRGVVPESSAAATNQPFGGVDAQKFASDVTTSLKKIADSVGPTAGPTVVTLDRSKKPRTSDQALWVVIRNSTNAISFNKYNEFMDFVMCGKPLPDDGSTTLGRTDQERLHDLLDSKSLPFPDVETYRLMKIATEVFLMVNCGVFIRPQDIKTIKDLNRKLSFDPLEESLRYNSDITETAFVQQFNDYVRQKLINGDGRPTSRTFPYLALIREKLHDVKLSAVMDVDHEETDLGRRCFSILRSKLINPCLLELIWSYWHEEGMLVQTTNAISLRFQNMRGPLEHDPLANLEIDPLRPLNNLLWGYIQDEQHRLTLQRRLYEYDHHYGLPLFGKAVAPVRSADSRSKFLEGFHNLLHLASVFYKEDDDTTRVADGFPLLNALRDVHLTVSEGAHNQFGDLPSTARQEMLMQEWLLARPEMREFLPTRIMVAYPEPWMDRVDAMKKLQGWTDTSVIHFRYLAVFGEQILLAIRFGAWSDEAVIHPKEAANWARYWRPEVQGYIHAYRAATGVDLSVDLVDSRHISERYLPPAVHLRHRLELQRQGR